METRSAFADFIVSQHSAAIIKTNAVLPAETLFNLFEGIIFSLLHILNKKKTRSK